jgi:probable F420-dependent oxidoreductase
VFSGRLKQLPNRDALAAAAHYESLGYGAIWLPESPAGKDVLTFAAVVLGGTTRIPIATGIAIIWARDPTAMMNAARTLVDAYADRFILGLGVSHRSTAEARGHAFQKPLAAMRSYLEAMDAAPYEIDPAIPVLRVLGALGPRMIELAAESTDGILPFLSNPEHTHRAREVLAGRQLIAVEQAVILSTDLAEARSVARANLSRYLGWVSYRRHMERMGFRESDLADGGSDRLVDALYAIGDEAAISRRLDDHFEAGADHVCIQVVPTGGNTEQATLEALAPAVL